VFREAATAVVKVGDGPEHSETILHLLVTLDKLTVSQILTDNRVDFVTLPRILILDLGLIAKNYKDRNVMVIKPRETLMLTSLNGDTKRYKWKAAIESSYEFHSEVYSAPRIGYKNALNVQDTPDIIFFESEDQEVEVRQHIFN